MNTVIAHTLGLILAAYIIWRFGGAAIDVLSRGSAATAKAKFKKTLTKIVVFGAAALFIIGLIIEYVTPAAATFLTDTGNWIAEGARDTSDTAGNAGSTVANNAPEIGLWVLIFAYGTAAMWWIFRTNDKQKQRIRTLISIGLLIFIMLGIKGMTYTA